MRAALLTTLVLAVFASGSPSVCDDESCSCDAHSRLICECTRAYDEVTIRPEGPYKVPYTLTAIIVKGCSRLFFMSDAIKDLIELKTIEIENVKNVYFREKSMQWSPYAKQTELLYPGLKVLINNSTISDLPSHTFKGRIDNIEIRNSKVQVMSPYAFSSLSGVKTIEFTYNDFDNIELQAFKKFAVDKFTIAGGTIKRTPSRMLSDVEITDTFKIDRVNIGDMSSSSFIITNPQRVVIENNVIGTMEGDTFHLISRGAVIFRNNTIEELKRGALLGISADKRTVNTNGRQELLIDNNTVAQASLDSFIFDRSSLTLRVDGLNLQNVCECESATAWLGLVTASGGTITCWSSLEGHFMSVATYTNSICGQLKQTFWIFIVIAVLLAFLGAAVVVCLVVRNENEKKKKMAVVLPDGKTYRETELHVIIERAEILTTDL